MIKTVAAAIGVISVFKIAVVTFKACPSFHDKLIPGIYLPQVAQSLIIDEL